jgi:hypothetical protein
MLKCGDCNGSMRYKVRKNKTCLDVASFRCSTWIEKGNTICRSNEINYDVVYKIVLADIQQYAVLAEQDERKLVSEILKANNKMKTQNLKRLEKEVREGKQRIKQIDKYYQSAYEDKVKKVITVERFQSMTADYDEEQAALTERIKPMENMYEHLKQTAHDVTIWVNKIKDCLKIETLTRAVIVGLIDTIEIKKTQDDNNAKAFDVTINYKFGAQKEIEPTFNHALFHFTKQ